MKLKVGDKIVYKKDNNYNFGRLSGNYYEVEEISENVIRVSETWYTKEHIWDFFYTPKETRKLKLEKINGKHYM